MSQHVLCVSGRLEIFRLHTPSHTFTQKITYIHTTTNIDCYALQDGEYSISQLEATQARAAEVADRGEAETEEATTGGL